jgi:hypothetical protein
MLAGIAKNSSSKFKPPEFVVKAPVEGTGLSGGVGPRSSPESGSEECGWRAASSTASFWPCSTS